MKAQVTWAGPGVRMVGETQNGPGIVVDSSAPSLGRHSGLSPMELVLVGLAGCTAMDVITIMAKKQQPMKNLQVIVEAERSETHPKVFTKIHVDYVAYGEGVEEQALARSIQLSEESYCSVIGMLKHTAAITHSCRIVSDPNPTLPGPLVDAT